MKGCPKNILCNIQYHCLITFKFIIIIMSKNGSLKATGPNHDKKVAWSDNPGQNIWNKIKKSNKIGQDKKSLISAFACFLTAITKV